MTQVFRIKLTSLPPDYVGGILVISGEILVFNGGCFSKDKQLYADIQSSRLENLVLPGRVKEELARA